MTPPTEPDRSTREEAASGKGLAPRPKRTPWQAFKDDPTYRATVLGVFVVPALLMAAVAAWVVRAVVFP